MLSKRLFYLSILTIVLLILAACGTSDSSQTADAPAEEVEVAEPTEAPPEESTESAEEAEEAPADSNAAAATGMRTFTIVPEESSASYVVQEEFLAGALSKLGINAGDVEVTGTSSDVTGQLQLDLGSDNPLGDNQFAVNLSTFATDQDRRDNWLRDRGPGFGSAPPAQFTATGIDGAPSSYTDGEEVTFTLSGDLTIRDVTNPVSFAVTATLSGDTITGSASTPSKLTDWNIEPPSFANTLTVADEFEIRLDFTARE